jgi:hypothetical protein
VLANVIIPAFQVPTTLVVFAPWVALLVCLIETVTLMPFMAKGQRAHAWWIVPVMNLASYLAGLVLFTVLPGWPTGINPEYGAEENWQQPYLPEWEQYVIIAFIGCYIASVLVEWPIIAVFKKRLRYRSSLVCGIAVNTASYGGIAALFALLAWAS